MFWYAAVWFGVCVWFASFLRILSTNWYQETRRKLLTKKKNPFPTQFNVVSKEAVYSLNQQGEISDTVWQE